MKRSSNDSERNQLCEVPVDNALVRPTDFAIESPDSNRSVSGQTEADGAAARPGREFRFRNRNMSERPSVDSQRVPGRVLLNRKGRDKGQQVK